MVLNKFRYKILRSLTLFGLMHKRVYKMITYYPLAKLHAYYYWYFWKVLLPDIVKIYLYNQYIWERSW